MLGLLDKFDQLTIETADKISESDKMFCIEEERKYKEAILVYSSFIEKIEEIYKTYPVRDCWKDGYIQESNIRKLKELIESFKNDFISKICRNFTSKYNVSINEDFKKKYGMDVNYKNIVDEIFIQLDGMSFYEKSVKEIKEKLKKDIYHPSKIKVAKTKLTIPNFVWVEKRWDGKQEVGYSSRDKLYKLFLALSHFETGKTDLLGYYNALLSYYRESHEFEKHDLGINKVESLKVFKNGKLEIEFQFNEQARQFAKEYCGYVEGNGVVQ